MRPAIGFDRDIKLEWLDAVATQVAASRTTQEVRASIHKMLDSLLASGIRPVTSVVVWPLVLSCCSSL